MEKNFKKFLFDRKAITGIDEYQPIYSAYVPKFETIEGDLLSDWQRGEVTKWQNEHKYDSDDAEKFNLITVYQNNRSYQRCRQKALR